MNSLDNSSDKNLTATIRKSRRWLWLFRRLEISSINSYWEDNCKQTSLRELLRDQTMTDTSGKQASKAPMPIGHPRRHSRSSCSSCAWGSWLIRMMKRKLAVMLLCMQRLGRDLLWQTRSIQKALWSNDGYLVVTKCTMLLTEVYVEWKLRCLFSALLPCIWIFSMILCCAHIGPDLLYRLGNKYYDGYRPT